MLLKNDGASFDALFNAINAFYSEIGNRTVLIFEEQLPSENSETGYFVRFLLDRKQVIEYRIATDRGFFLSILSLAIGPHYFIPGEFWNYEDAQRFSLEPSTEAVVHNLKLLDEFFESR